MIRTLAEHMPHLRNVNRTVCRNPQNWRVFCYDVLETDDSARLVESLNSPSTIIPLTDRIRLLKTHDSRNVRTRFIFVEDLTPEIIEAFGSTFWMNPEFFEGHLNCSGYPHEWNTNASQRRFVSVRWFRPVHRLRSLSVDGAPLARMAHDNVQFGSSNKVKTNIFRGEWALISNPDMLSEVSGTYTAAWEEKITLQVTYTPGCPPMGMLS